MTYRDHSQKIYNTTKTCMILLFIVSSMYVMWICVDVFKCSPFPVFHVHLGPSIRKEPCSWLQTGRLNMVPENGGDAPRKGDSKLGNHQIQLWILRVDYKTFKLSWLLMLQSFASQGWGSSLSWSLDILGTFTYSNKGFFVIRRPAYDPRYIYIYYIL